MTMLRALLPTFLLVVIVGGLPVAAVVAEDRPAARPVRDIPRDVQSQLDALAKRGADCFEQGDLRNERDARREWLRLFLTYRPAEDPEARTRQAMLDSAQRALALGAAQQARLREARQRFIQAVEAGQKEEYQAATEAIESCTPVFRELLGERDYFYLQAVWLTATIAHNQGQSEGVEAQMKVAIEGYEAILGQQHPDVARKQTDLGRWYCSQQRWEEAERTLQRAREIHHRQDLALDGDWASLQLLWSRVLLERGRYVDAQRAAEQLIALASTAEDYAKAELLGYLVLGQCQVKQQKHQAGVDAFEYGFRQLLAKKLLEADELTLSAMRQFAAAYRQLGCQADAESVEAQAARLSAALAAHKQQRKK